MMLTVIFAKAGSTRIPLRLSSSYFGQKRHHDLVRDKIRLIGCGGQVIQSPWVGMIQSVTISMVEKEDGPGHRIPNCWNSARNRDIQSFLLKPKLNIGCYTIDDNDGRMYVCHQVELDKNIQFQLIPPSTKLQFSQVENAIYLLNDNWWQLTDSVSAHLPSVVINY